MSLPPSEHRLLLAGLDGAPLSLSAVAHEKVIPSTQCRLLRFLRDHEPFDLELPAAVLVP